MFIDNVTRKRWSCPLARRHTTTRVLAFDARPNETHDARLVILRRRRASRDARDAARATHDDARGRDLDARRLDRRASARATRTNARRASVVAGASAIDALGEFAERAQAATANAHATLATSRVFDVADAAAATAGIDLNDAEALKAAGLQKGGWLGPITDGLESALEGIDSVLDGRVPYSYGFSIIVLTVLVKLATFPLSKKQVESSMQMQAMQPRIKELQAMYANDPERLQMEQARLYKEAGFNPLAGCLPVFATLPVFIGLYRALSNAASEGLLTDGFYWIPSLGGPTSIASRNAGSGFAWLWPFVDGHPPLGWHDTAAYLVLPVLLVASQYVSQQIVSPQPKTDDPAQQQSQAILKFLPLMIGFFSLNVPAGLTLYWFANNIITTAQTLILRKTTTAPEPPVAKSAWWCERCGARAC